MGHPARSHADAGIAEEPANRMLREERLAS
jgi:hypothetical protein